MTAVVTTWTRHGSTRFGHQHYRTPAGPLPPLRFTSRGRIVVAGVSAAIVGLLSLGLATMAQASGHAGQSGQPGRYVTKVVVQPGQSLWSLAEAYDPEADPRQVIQQVLQLNALGSEQLRPGQVLWLPRD